MRLLQIVIPIAKTRNQCSFGVKKVLTNLEEVINILPPSNNMLDNSYYKLYRLETFIDLLLICRL